MEKYILGCDWGTSSFRLRLLNVPAQEVVGELVSDVGIAKMHASWQTHIEQEKAFGKKQLFRQYLKKQIDMLSARINEKLANITILISGMASSSIGMEDVPYATVPFAVDGSQAKIKRIEGDENLQHEIILISGVRSDNDVMRGEETQLIGLLALLEQSGNKPSGGILIFPGTHSKHITIQNNQLIGFRTFMTGELFNVIHHYSILKDSIENDKMNNLSDADATAFTLGVRQVQTSGILNGLFTVRTNQLFEKLSKKENFFYLSGLLIGEELSYLLKTEEPLFLCSGSNLNRFYTVAFEELGLTSRASIVPVELVDQSALYGQKLIFQNFTSTELK